MLRLRENSHVDQGKTGHFATASQFSYGEGGAKGGSLGGLCDAPWAMEHLGEGPPLPLLPSEAGKKWLSEGVQKDKVELGLVLLLFSLISSHHVPGTVLGSGITMADMPWSCP